MTSLSIVVMAHPRRADFIPYLKEKLGDVPVIWDRKNDIWDTCRRAWLAHDRNCDYGLVIQDDAIVCDNFRERAVELLGEDMIYSFFAGYMLGSRILRAEKDGKQHVDSGMIFNEVALCMKTKHINDMVAYCDSMQATTDQEITNWARLRRKKIRYPIPSLIDHRDEEPSLFREIYNRPAPHKPRKAFRYVGH